MSRKLTPALVVATVLAISAACAGAAVAQKGVLGYGTNPTKGITDPSGGHRYTAINIPSGTLIEKRSTDGGAVERYELVGRQLVVPAVAYDGSAGGLSADGETLVLAQPGTRFPQTRSDFAVLDTDRLRVRDVVSLGGTFTFDALSPDGSTLYLIEYTSPRDLTEYTVRSYDIERGRLDRAPIIDPDESAEDMYGTPVSRETAPSGRWEYTLYDGVEHPFVHALNTARGTAVCIDLEHLPRVVPGRAELEPSADGATLTVSNSGKAVADVDLSSFEVSEPAAPPAPDASAADDGDGLPWALIAGGAALLICAAALVAWRRRPERAAEAAGLEPLVELDRAGSEAESGRTKPSPAAVEAAAGKADVAKEREPVA